MAMPPTNKLRVMVDANILVAGTGWPRFPYEVLQHALTGDYTLLLTAYVIDEAREHLSRIMPHRLAHFEEFLVLSHYEKAPTPSPEIVAANRDLVRDPKDVPIALAAIQSQVDYLVTQDKDFTMRDESTAELHRRLKIMLPGTFLREHMGWTSISLEEIRRRVWEDFED